MSQTTIQIDSVDYRLFVTRESATYRVFWFCPFRDCYGSYRSEQLCSTKEEAFRLGSAAAHRHHMEAHAHREVDAEVAGVGSATQGDELRFPEMTEADIGRVRIFG